MIAREKSPAKNENSNQGSFIIDELTERVEAIAEHGGVLAAMELGYQRGKIQQESLHYERLKHTGEWPIIGANAFRAPHANEAPQPIELARSTEEEKQSQLARLADFHARHAAQAPELLARLKRAALDGRNVFEVLM